MSEEFQGKVVRILDGDTVEVMHNNRAERIRLNGINCPEKKQSFGQQAKELTSALCFGKNVTVQSFKGDRYGRTIGELWVEGQDVNQEIVRRGMAWWYRKYTPKDTVLEKLEQDAKSKQLGLWKDKNPIAPWDFRHGIRTYQKD